MRMNYPRDDRLHAFLAHCDYCLQKLEFLDAVYKGANYEIHALLEQWHFCAKHINKACDFLHWLAWNTYEFYISCSDLYIPPPCIPNYAPPVCRIYQCPDHNKNSCCYYISNDGFASDRNESTQTQEGVNCVVRFSQFSGK